MFSLIITIVSIALVVALVAATMNHGGDTLTQGRVSADASAFVNAAQQISSAALIHQAFKGTAPADIDALVTNNYLSSKPVVKSAAAGPLALDSATYAGYRVVKATIETVGVDGAAICKQINMNAGFPDGTGAQQAGNILQADALSKSFGCITSSNIFLFKY